MASSGRLAWYPVWWPLSAVTAAGLLSVCPAQGCQMTAGLQLSESEYVGAGWLHWQCDHGQAQLLLLVVVSLTDCVYDSWAKQLLSHLENSYCQESPASGSEPESADSWSSGRDQSVPHPHCLRVGQLSLAGQGCWEVFFKDIQSIRGWGMAVRPS